MTREELLQEIVKLKRENEQMRLDVAARAQDASGSGIVAVPIRQRTPWIDRADSYVYRKSAAGPARTTARVRVGEPDAEGHGSRAGAVQSDPLCSRLAALDDNPYNAVRDAPD
eukprot:1771363-Prymnesium_polylepis.1